MTTKRNSLYHGNAEKSKGFFFSLKHAIRGVALALLLEANVRRQILIFIIVVALSFWLRLELWQLVAIVFAGVAVISFELFNSALESLADAVHPDYSEYIQRAKDMMAAAVLLVSIAALVLAVCIFIPVIVIKFSQYQ